MANTNYPVATGGTPIISWLINQIDAVLMYELKLISAIERLCTEHNNNNEYKKIKDTWQNKKDMLLEHIEELKKKDYQVELIYSKNKERCLNDDK
jgi:predicted methyltransferase MtxX (methanogen marker protein 4)